MDYLIHRHPHTLEPIGIWEFPGSDTPPTPHYPDDRGREHDAAQMSIDEYVNEDWIYVLENLSDRTPYTILWDWISSDLEVEALRDQL